VSDSILYLAIVGIWAGFLIPAWVRRPHTSRLEYDSELELADSEAGFDAQEDGVMAASTMAGLADTADDIAVDIDTRLHVEIRPGISEYRDDVHTHNYDPAGPRPDGLDASVTRPSPGRSPGRSPGPSQSREQMMRARRRMLTILTGLTLLTASFVITGLVQWWICVPPVAMLVLYVLLLREIAMADAELARKRHAWEARQARAAHAPTAWQRSHQAWETESAEPTAEIIDISARVGDQLYDQYADAAVRAVGD
jgi:hypothetical protein